MVEIEQKRYADDITMREFVKLRVENERLRDTLQLILDHPVEETGEWETAVEEMKALAHQVLERSK